MSDSFEDLDKLVGSAIARARQTLKDEARKVIRKTAEPERVSTQALYLDPANWERTRGITLLHAETETVLGNFSEYVHRSVAGCRKLLRETSPIAISATERISGEWWISEQFRPAKRDSWHEKRPAIIHLHLDKLHLHAPGCEVVAHLSYGSLARVELAADTQFAAEGDASPNQLVFLPAGANVLEVMSGDCKRALMKELGR